jgi:hypothetical protein
VLSTAALAKRAALEVLQGEHGGSVRAAAAHYNIPFHYHVWYYVNKWEDTEVSSLVLASPMAVDQVDRVSSPMADSPPRPHYCQRFQTRSGQSQRARPKHGLPSRLACSCSAASVRSARRWR